MPRGVTITVTEQSAASLDTIHVLLLPRGSAALLADVRRVLLGKPLPRHTEYQLSAAYLDDGERLIGIGTRITNQEGNTTMTFQQQPASDIADADTAEREAIHETAETITLSKTQVRYLLDRLDRMTARAALADALLAEYADALDVAESPDPMSAPAVTAWRAHLKAITRRVRQHLQED